MNKTDKINKINWDLKQLEVREIMRSVSTDYLEIVFIEAKRELDKRFFENQNGN